MSEEIEKLIKIQGVINKRKYHLHITTDLQEKAEWYLYQKFAKIDDFLRIDNSAILESRIDTIDELISYLGKHNGFEREYEY